MAMSIRGAMKAASAFLSSEPVSIFCESRVVSGWVSQKIF
jgi:hypothetical protein